MSSSKKFDEELQDKYANKAVNFGTNKPSADRLILGGKKQEEHELDKYQTLEKDWLTSDEQK